jgi:hypothetical protein
MKLTRKTWLAILAGAVLASPAAIAADHNDGTQVMADPSADITDVYAWMTDANHMALVMDVMPNSGTTAQFSDTVKYVFHTTTWAGFTGTIGTGDPEVDVICTFDASGNPSCWVAFQGDSAAADVIDYVSGTAAAANSATGITSADGDIQLFAGPRNDPFFFNLDGFHNAIATVEGAVPSLVDAGAFNAAGCPAVGATTSGVLLGELGHDLDGGAPLDDFAGQDVLSIVLNININNPTNPNGNLLQTGNTLLSVWASTNN